MLLSLSQKVGNAAFEKVGEDWLRRSRFVPASPATFMPSLGEIDRRSGAPFPVLDKRGEGTK
jgi:hypothetical protein